MRRALALALVALTGCDVAIRIDPEGYRCDNGACPQGFNCVDDVCRRAGIDRCQGVACTSPPAQTCLTPSVARSFTGRCDPGTGTCIYDPVDTTCGGGCVNDACVNLCIGKVCNTPPSPSCLDASRLSTWSQLGNCSPASGQCSYPQTITTCPQGCANNGCTGMDPCATVTCTTPPDPSCQSPTVARTWSNPGVCDAGACTYTPSDTTCPSTCALGVCVTPGLTFTQVGPRVRFAINAIDNAPGSSGDNVVAVGNGGQVARWNGFSWTTVAGPATTDLNAVSFVTSGTAVIVGRNRTAWLLRTSSGNLTAIAGVPGPAAANLVSVSGRSEANVLIADDSGGWLKLGSGGSWTSGSFPPADGPFKMKAAYVDESGRERVVGLCGPAGSTSSCVAYRNPTSGTSWAVDTDSDSQGVAAIGGSFDVATSSGSDALLGKPNLDLVRHNNSGSFTVQSTTPVIEGGGVVGVSAVATSSGSRAVYVLTSRGSSANGLYRLTKQTSGTVTADGPLVETYFGRESLSSNEATGVMVAETKVAAGVNNIFRRSVVVNDALDLGEDFTGVTTDGALGLVLVSRFGDVAIRRVAANVFSFTRGPYVLVKAAEGRNGTGVLIVGKDGNSSDGYLERFAAGSFTRIAATAGATTFHAVCRVSDQEAYAVGTGGTIFSINGTTAQRMASNTSADLNGVDCPTPGAAVACGAGGVVLRLSGGTWSPLPSPGSVLLNSCRLTGSAVYAAGDAYFGRLDQGAAAWTPLNARPGLVSLLIRAPNDIYAASVTGSSSSDIVRFDGSNWSTLLPVTEAVGGGVQIGARVVFGGSDGAIMEGR